jgi:leucyl aminopeptidase
MEISKELQEQQTKAEDLFFEAKSAQRQFVIMAEAEGLSEREMRARWLDIVDWGSKERSAELWKANLAAALDDEEIHEVVESMDKLEEELMTYVEPEDLLEQTEALMVQYDRQLKELMIAYGSHLAGKGMSVRDVARAVAKVLGRKLPDAEDDDPFADDTLE